MKQIVAVPIWYNGQLKEAKWLNIYVASIMLGVSAQINYELFEGQVGDGEAIGAGTKLAAGQLTLDGDDYSNWGSDDDYVWIWSADKLNLTIITNN
jgi:hypothetical protein